MSNLLCVNPYKDQFMWTAINNIRSALDKFQIKSLEIQFKFAEFKYFGISFNENQMGELPSALRQKFYNMYLALSNQHFETLANLSHQSIINLNPLGKETYQVNAGFNEYKHKKFYHIRELLLKMCQFNSKPNNQPNKQQQPLNIYRQLSLNYGNHLLKLIQEGELRMDIYIHQRFGLKNLAGRYSYSDKSGWSKVVKSDICTKLDYMLNQRTFRMGISQEIQEQVSSTTLGQISYFLKNNPKSIDVRLKRILRVKKGQISQYALSQIYQINQKTGLSDFSQQIVQNPKNLNKYIKKLFINFYSLQQRQTTKYQIENEFTHATLKRMKKYFKNNQIHLVKNEIQFAIQELHALYFADHSTKIKEIPWLNSICQQMPEARLQNQFGSYMRDELYSKMNSTNP